MKWVKIVNSRSLKIANFYFVYLFGHDIFNEYSNIPVFALSQIQDMVAIRHTASNEQQRTTMILLCEDGSLRIYMANVENTSFWLQPALQPSSGISILKPVRKRKAAATSEFMANLFFFFLNCL